MYQKQARSKLKGNDSFQRFSLFRKIDWLKWCIKNSLFIHQLWISELFYLHIQASLIKDEQEVPWAFKSASYFMTFDASKRGSTQPKTKGLSGWSLFFLDRFNFSIIVVLSFLYLFTVWSHRHFLQVVGQAKEIYFLPQSDFRSLHASSISGLKSHSTGNFA